MIELAQLFQDMEAAVVQQEPAITNIDDKAEDTNVNMNKGNQQLDQAVVKARSARKKKWICLGIVRKLSLAPLPRLQSASLIACSSHHPHHRSRRGRCGRSPEKPLMALSPHHRHYRDRSGRRSCGL